MNRRRFIKRGLFGGVILAAGGSLTLGLASSKLSYKPVKWLRVLDERQFAIIGAIAARTVRVEGADPAAIAHGVDEILALAVPETQSDVKSLLLLFENALAGFLFGGRARPFTRLDAAEQDAVLASWRDSRITLRRGGYHALRKLTLSAYYASPAVWEGVGYPGPPEIAV